MSILKRVKKLEEQLGRKEKGLIIGIRRFSEGPGTCLPSRSRSPGSVKRARR